MKKIIITESQLKTLIENMENNIPSNEQITSWLQENWPKDKLNEWLEENMYDYVGFDEVEESKYETVYDFYINHMMGGAVEWNWLEQVRQEIMEEFNITQDDYFSDKNDINAITHNYLIDNFADHDSYVFKRKKLNSEKNDEDDSFGKGWDRGFGFGDIKF